MPMINEMVLKLKGFQYAIPLDLNMEYDHIWFSEYANKFCTMILLWGNTITRVSLSIFNQHPCPQIIPIIGYWCFILDQTIGGGYYLSLSVLSIYISLDVPVSVSSYPTPYSATSNLPTTTRSLFSSPPPHSSIYLVSPASLLSSCTNLRPAFSHNVSWLGRITAIRWATICWNPPSVFPILGDMTYVSTPNRRFNWNTVL